MIDKVRRLVSGEPGSGTEAVWTHAEEIVPMVMGAAKFYDIWGYDEAPRLPYCNNEPYEAYSVFPPPGGLRVVGVVYPPRSGGAGAHTNPANTGDVVEKRRAMNEAVPHGRLHGSKPGMHRTDTIDFGIVISGEVVTELEGGGEQTLRPGDVYIQNGAMHAWRNDTDEPALIVFVFVPAERDGG